MHEEGRGGSHPKHSTAFQHLWIEGLGREFQLWQLHWEQWEGLGMHCRLQPGLREAGAISELIPVENQSWMCPAQIPHGHKVAHTLLSLDFGSQSVGAPCLLLI